MIQKLPDFQSAREITDTWLNVFLQPKNDLTARITEAMRYSAVSEGKAFRPFLILTIGKMLKCPPEITGQLAAAVEMIHTYSLIHDDLPAMDNDAMRRGKPSNHIQFDEATAILAGDALLTKGIEVISTLPVPAPKRCRLIAELTKAIGDKGMIGGQMIDLIGEKQPLSLSEIQQMQTLKTGELIAFSCKAPCYIAPLCSPAKRVALTRFGYAIGHLFQITDDLLDLYGKTETVGKTLGKDEKSHKSTMVARLGQEKIRLKMREYAQTAQEALTAFGKKKVADLEALIAYIVNREK